MKRSNFGALQSSYCKRNVQLEGDSFVSQSGEWEAGDKETYGMLLMDLARVTTVSSISRICQICWESSPCNSSGYSARCPWQSALPAPAALLSLCLWTMSPWQGPNTSAVSSEPCPAELAHNIVIFCMGLPGSSGFHLGETQQESMVWAVGSWDNSALAAKLINCLIISWVI